MRANAVGTGPYLLTNYEQPPLGTIEEDTDNFLVYERNDNWWKSKANLVPPPALKTIRVHIQEENL